MSQALSLSTTDSVVTRTTSTLNRLFPAPRAFTIRLWNGTEVPASGTSAFSLILNHPGALRRMFTPPTELSLGEAFINGDLDIDGDIFAAFTPFDVIFNLTLPPASSYRWPVTCWRCPVLARPDRPDVAHRA